MTASAKRLLSYSLKAAILVLAFIFIYRRIDSNENLRRFESLIANIDRNRAIFVMSCVFLLMLINWILESLKWKYLTRELVSITTWQAIEAVFCGLTWAVFTPNRIGEYGGRVMFLPNRKRIHGIFAMAVGSFGQNVITNVLGLSALMWFAFTYLNINIAISLALSLAALGFMALLLVFYFNIGWLVTLLNRIKFLEKYHRFFDIMARYHTTELLNIMWFCLTRFFVFSFQYFLVIHLLIPSVPVFPMMMMVFILFFVQSALPSLDLLDVGVRSMTASAFFAYITDQNIAVMAAVSSIWFINLIVPAILGSVFVLKLRFFDRSS
ncbi:hypothetical protein [Mucilaginibacter ginsenosidivorans]|uniref:Flippase-like domain-containing protein n=1 Tax=Mucilaginibacter ginsenosidivorans TaxID=398053 RepID=A0A5B8US97_9SPHI|nr:hypothetical protein [Mucilaginibacter ginsenosidivorans]QEC61782.1 hypothetical protein FRZ54_04010 [Mucilaginibacter ginsenosidivorans]